MYTKLIGKTIKSITGLSESSEVVIINFTDGSLITQTHDQDCCETVQVEQVDGPVAKHIGAKFYGLDEKEIGNYEQVVNGYDSLTATFYTLKTSAGYLDWRWYGESNGYYSESVDTSIIAKRN